MTRRRNIKKQKKPVFFGCEGDSEAAYGQIINDILMAADIAIHLNVKTLHPGAGDPLARVIRAQKYIRNHEQKRGRFWHKVILMDNDQVAENRKRAADAQQIARQINLNIIWQDPCHEAVLLRHLPDCVDHRPPSSQIAINRLTQQWPGYKKPMTRMQLSERINFNGIQQAATVEGGLNTFFRHIGLLI